MSTHKSEDKTTHESQFNDESRSLSLVHGRRLDTQCMDAMDGYMAMPWDMNKYMEGGERKRASARGGRGEVSLDGLHACLARDRRVATSAPVARHHDALQVVEEGEGSSGRSEREGIFRPIA